MISRVRIEAEGWDASTVATQLEALAAHVMMAAYLEGVSGGGWRITEEVIERGIPQSGMENVTGRKVLKFEEAGVLVSEPVHQYGYVVSKKHVAQPGELADADGFTDQTSDVTDEVIVIERRFALQRPAAPRPSDESPLESGPYIVSG